MSNEKIKIAGRVVMVAQYPYEIGSLGVHACEVAAAGKELPANIESPTALVTKNEAGDAMAKFPQPFQQFDNPLSPLLDSKR